MYRSARRILRRLVLSVFSRVNPGDITITHHHTGDRVRCHSFRHRNYWVRGAGRERATNQLFARVIRPGDTVLDVGANIGYVSLLLSQFVGPTGRVFAFEPGPNNLPYARMNLGPRTTITLVEKAVGSANETRDLVCEDLSGQNNSFLADLAELRYNESLARRANRSTVAVEVVTLDDFCAARGLRPDFIKVDVEGFESEVVRGARRVVEECLPAMMVEVFHERERVIEFFGSRGYVAVRPDRGPVSDSDIVGNTFFLHPSRHGAVLDALGSAGAGAQG